MPIVSGWIVRNLFALRSDRVLPATTIPMSPGHQLHPAARLLLLDAAVTPLVLTHEECGHGLTMAVHVGTSGWSYDHWVGVLYPKSAKSLERLDAYARHFRTVEVNNTFYRWPKDEVFSTWRERSPKGFIFSAKASRGLTSPVHFALIVFMTGARTVPGTPGQAAIIAARSESLSWGLVALWVTHAGTRTAVCCRFWAKQEYFPCAT